MKTPQLPAMPGIRHCIYPKCLKATRGGFMCGDNCPSGNRPVVPLNRLATDEKTAAERKWTAPLKPKADQQACDVGLFSDDSKQTELF